MIPMFFSQLQSNTRSVTHRIVTPVDNMVATVNLSMYESDVSLDGVNVSGYIYLYYDSVVKLKDAYLEGSFYVLHNNSVLILENVSFVEHLTVKIYDTATVILKDTNDNATDMDFKIYDHGKLYTENAHMIESDLYGYDNCSVDAYNSTFDRVMLYENSTVNLHNTTVTGPARAYDTSSFSAYNVTFQTSIYLYETSESYFEKVLEKTHDIYLSNNATLTLRNSTVDDIYTGTGYNMVTIINSTVDTFRSHSGVISNVYTSTINKIIHSFLVQGTGIFTNGILELTSGTFVYNIYNDSTTHVNSFMNETYFYVVSGNLSIVNETTKISFVSAENSVIDVRNTYHVSVIQTTGTSLSVTNVSKVDTLSSHTSSLLLNSSVVGNFYFYDSQISIFNVSGLFSTSSIYAESSVIDGKNLTLPSVYLFELSQFSVDYLRLTKEMVAYDNSSFTTMHSDLNDTQIDITNSSFTVQWSNLASSTMTFYNGSAQISFAILSKASITVYNTTVNVSNSKSAIGPGLDGYTSSVISLHNVSIKGIDLHDDTNLTITGNSSIQNIYTYMNSSSIINIINSTVGYLNALESAVRAISQNSSFSVVEYIVNITGGVVNVTNYEIVGDTSNYYSTFVYDTNTNVTSLRLNEISVYSATTYLRNQLIEDLIFATDSEMHLDNVSVDYIYYDGSVLSVNNSMAMGIFAGNIHSPLTVNLNNLTATYVYLGVVVSLTGEFSIAGSAFGNLTNSEIMAFFVNDGEFGVSNDTLKNLVPGPFTTIYVYNSTIYQLYQSYVFTHDGSIYLNDATDYTSLGAINVTGNVITLQTIGFVANLNGTLTVNAGLDFAYYGYNNSKAMCINSTDLEGFVLRDNATLYLNNSQSRAFPFAQNHLMDNAKLYSNSSLIYAVALFDTSYAEVFNTTFNGYFSSDLSFTICLYNSSKMKMVDAEIGGSPSGAVCVMNNAQLLARNANVTVSSLPAGLSFNDSAVVSWNESIFSFYNLDNLITLSDDAQVYFSSVTVFGNGTAMSDRFVSLYNTSRLVANNFTMWEIGAGIVFLITYDFSETILYNSSVYTIYVRDNTTVLAYNILFCNLYAYGNSTATLLNDHHQPNADGYVNMLHSAATVTITNTTLTWVYLTGTATLSLYDIDNGTTGLEIYVEELAFLYANNLTANYIYFFIDALTHPTGHSTLNNTIVETLVVAHTLHKTGNANFTGLNINASPSSILFNNTELRNVSYVELNQALYILDNVKVNGTNCELYLLHVALVNDDKAPVIIATPSSLAFEKGVSNKILTFTVTEDNPDYYVVKRNGTTTKIGVYENGSVVIVDASALAPGNWAFTFFANDTSGNSAVASVNVMVYPSEPPTFTSKPPHIYNMTEGTTGNILNWTAVDHSPSTYKLYVDGTLVANGTWTSGTPISYNIDAFSVGTHNVTLVIFDEVGNNATSSVTVAVASPSLIPEVPIPLEYLIIIVVIVIVLLVVAIYLIKKRRK